MKRKKWLMNGLSVLAILIGGFLLFLAGFMLAALVINGTIRLLGLPDHATPPLAGRIVFLLVLIVLSIVVFLLRLPDVVKATYLTMPLMVALVLMGIVFYGFPTIVVFGIGCLIVLSVVFFLIWKKLSWMYYFATAYVSVLALCILLFRIDI